MLALSLYFASQPDGRGKGFTLVELMVGMAIIAMLALVGLPSFMQWTQNAKTRAAAESVLTGLQIARAEAVSRNAPVFFELQPASTSLLWRVGCVTVQNDSALASFCPELLASRELTEGNIGTLNYSTDTDGTKVVFDSFGRKRVVPINAGDFSQVEIDNPQLPTNKGGLPQRIILGAGGAVRMCDVELDIDGDPRKCP